MGIGGFTSWLWIVAQLSFNCLLVSSVRFSISQVKLLPIGSPKFSAHSRGVTQWSRLSCKKQLCLCLHQHQPAFAQSGLMKKAHIVHLCHRCLLAQPAPPRGSVGEGGGGRRGLRQQETNLTVFVEALGEKISRGPFSLASCCCC